MSEYKLMEHRENSGVKFWAREVGTVYRYTPNFPVGITQPAYEVKYPRKMYADAKDVPAAELCVWSGYLPTDAVRKLYREV